MQTWQHLKPSLQILTAIFLMLLLSGCANRTETVSTQVIIKLPPAGMLVPCHKPSVQGTWPEVVSEDIPKLKNALTQCDTQIEDYLHWRAQHEQPTERETP
ncbi:Rz1-like lysis system protein LysC [Vibrio metschnikovii]|uniref:Rz1-like lysis system protein LysC n=1 Tax=Vibrio metschnikovii TaxID=28172 RepID=UPI003B97E608